MSLKIKVGLKLEVMGKIEARMKDKGGDTALTPKWSIKAGAG